VAVGTVRDQARQKSADGRGGRRTPANETEIETDGPSPGLAGHEESSVCL
jgi:hypothetical protein